MDHSRNSKIHLYVWRLTSVSIFTSFAAFLLSFLAYDWIFHIFVAAEFHHISHLLPWMVLAGGLFASSQVLSLKLMSEMKVATLTKAKIYTAILGVLFNIYGAYFAGIQGVVFALLAYSFISFVWLAVLSLSLLNREPTISS